MKKIILILSIFFLASCSNKNIDNPKSNNIVSKERLSSNVSEKKDIKKLEYSYDYMDGFKRDKSLYVDRMLGAYPSEVNSNKNSPYTLDELKNLDYNKNLSLSLFNIRIPQRSEVFSNDDYYVIDFPKTDAYEISIKIEKLFADGEKDSHELLTKLNEFALNFTSEKAKDGKNISQDVVNINSDYKNTSYSILEDNKYTYTNIFMATPANIINFELIENKEKSKISPLIMADLLSTAYPESEDVPVISKSFNNYEDKINLYATEKIDFEDFCLKIPSDMKKNQASDSLVVYENELSGKTINQILISMEKKENDLSLKDFFYKSQGTNIPPAFISSMGRVREEMIHDRTFLKSRVRIYTEQFSLEGEKISFETKNSYVTIILTGPLKNTNKTDLLNNNIINSLQIKN